MRERLVADIPRELAQVEAKGRMLKGYASVFNYPIPGWQGQTTFIKPGAFKRTISKDRDAMQVMFNHGKDPRYGELPIGTISKLEENSTGLYAEVELHDGPDNENIRSALAAGALRAMSIQFETEQEDFSDDHTERYIQQVKLWEFGPVAFPANQAATASLHSAFDWRSSVLESQWDGAAAMRSCSSAAEFRKIAFERNNDSDPDTAAHWTLPHHPSPSGAPGNADSGGVGAALAALHGGRGGPPDLKPSVATVEAHLTGHQSESSSLEARHSLLEVADTDWLLKAGRRLEAEGLDLEEAFSRMHRLK